MSTPPIIVKGKFMDTFRKMLKCKSMGETLKILPYSFFDISSFIIFALYAANPLLTLLKNKLFPSLFIHWQTYNRITLILGAALLIIYLIKLKIDGIRINPKDFLKNNPPIALFGVFALLMLISTAVNGFTALSFFGNYYRAEGMLGYLSYIVYFLLACINRSERLKRLWLYWFVWTSAVLEMYTVSDFYINGDYELDFVFDQYNHYGYYLMMSLAVSSMLIIISEKTRQKLLFSASAVLSCLALIINDTFGCQLAAIAGLVFIIIIYPIAKGRFKAKVIVPAIIFTMTFVGAGISSPVLSEQISKNYSQIINDVFALTNGKEEAEASTGVSRIILWENTCRYIGEKPVFGFGADGTWLRLLSDTNDNDRCHCEYLNYAVCFGIPAAAVYVAAVFLIYLRGLKHKKQLTELNLLGLCTAMFYLASATVGNSMYSTAPLLYILLGFGYYGKPPCPESKEITTT